jgi:hypothetical protein
MNGNPCFIDMGLKGDDYNTLTATIDTLLCLYPRLLPQQKIANLSAIAEEIIQFLSASQKSPRVIFLSSVDIAGAFDRILAERDLAILKPHINHHSRELFEAESILHQWTQTPITIIRSGMVTGCYPDLLPLVQMLLAGMHPFESEASEKRLISTNVEDLAGFVAWLCHQPPATHTFHYFENTPVQSKVLARTALTLCKAQLNNHYDVRDAARADLVKESFAVNEFFGHNNIVAAIQNSWTNRFLEANNLPLPHGLTATLETLVEYVAETIAGYR